MKIKIKLEGTKFNEWISERNHKFTCKRCGEVYGKKGRYIMGGDRITICLECFIAGYKHYAKMLISKKDKNEVKKILKEIKKKYELDLVVGEL